MRLKVNKQQIKLIHNKCSCLINPKCTASVQSVTKKICIKKIQNQFNDLFFGTQCVIKQKQLIKNPYFWTLCTWKPPKNKVRNHIC